MSYDNEKLNYGKEHIQIVDLVLEGCFQTAGTSPCLATATGDEKCFNTVETCNYIDPGTGDFLAKTSLVDFFNIFRFYQSRSPAPIGMAGSNVFGQAKNADPIPCLKSVNIAPTKIDLAGGLGVRASVTCTFTDFPHSDIGIDKYIDDRTYIASDRGTFWTKLRARNPDYQNKELRVLSGFLVDGVFDINNFTTRYYIIDKMTVTDGMCTIVAKDPLKLASNKKAQAPAASTGRLSANIAIGDTSATLVPAGVGDLEYPASGKVLIKSEVISFTRVADALTLTRGQNNTVATDHASNDTVQLCLEYDSKQVDFIVKDLLTNYANIKASYIPDSAWAAEVGTFLSGLLSGIIVKPFDVFKLLKELAESMPHYLWWDEREQAIQLTALKAPPENNDVIDMDENIIADTFKTSDKPELRKSTIFVNFGQFDPTKRLDEFSNYQQTYARIDTDSISKYGSNEIKTINSRWISNTNKAAALQLAALIGRRFSDIPREVNFSLEVKDSNFWVGQSVDVNHRDIVDFTGSPIDTTFQLLSSKEGHNFDYSAIEFTYGEELPEDEGGGDPDIDLVVLAGNLENINLLEIYESQFPAPDPSTQAKFIIENGAIIGSLSNTEHAIDTGSWPIGAAVTLQANTGSFIVGRGGIVLGAGGQDGGDAITLNHDLTLINNGVIGGGGGGGGNGLTQDVTFTFTAKGGGGGGAGSNLGNAASTFTTLDGTYVFRDSTNSTIDQGGVGGQVLYTTGNSVASEGGSGGDLGESGAPGVVGDFTFPGGEAGDAINKNGYVLTETVTGDIRGNITA